MTLFRCDWTWPTYGTPRCPDEATMAFERDDGYGQEIRHFCRHHLPHSWTSYDRVYKIVHDELIEIGITKQRREPIPVTVPIGEPVPREMIRDAVARYWEKKRDVLIMRGLGVKYE